jgi:hypothetical protein
MVVRGKKKDLRSCTQRRINTHHSISGYQTLLKHLSTLEYAQKNLNLNKFIGASSVIYIVGEVPVQVNSPEGVSLRVILNLRRTHKHRNLHLYIKAFSLSFVCGNTGTYKN